MSNSRGLWVNLLFCCLLLAMVWTWSWWVRRARVLATGYYSFQDVTEAAGIRWRHPGPGYPLHIENTAGPGLGFGDYDGDGYPDLMMAAGYERGPHALYRNRGDGTFEDVTAESGIYRPERGGAAVFFDAENRGEQDLAFSLLGSNWLARNRGDGTYTIRRIGPGLETALPSSVAAADYDGDGFVDVYLDNYILFQPDSMVREYRDTATALNPAHFQGARKFLLRSLRGKEFEDVTYRAGVANEAGRSLGVVFADFQNRNRPDILISNDLNANALFSNLGGGRFINVAMPANVASGRSGMGIAVGDYDCDGDLDVFITHFSSQRNALYRNDLIRGGRSIGRLFFTDVADEAGLGLPSDPYVGWGTQFLDVDGDGWLDLFVLNGHILPDESSLRHLIAFPPHLFMQTQPGRFEEVGRGEGPFATQLSGRGLATADYDRDGRPDVGFVGIEAPAYLWRNISEAGNHWLDVELRGRAGPQGARTRADGTKTSNRDGIGARIYLATGRHIQMREVMCGAGVMGWGSLVQNFGVAFGAEIDSLKVRWPGGAVQTFEGMPTNRYLVIREPENQGRPPTARPFPSRAGGPPRRSAAAPPPPG